MRYATICCIILLVCSVTVLGQYVRATKYSYTAPRQVQYPITPCQIIEPDQSSLLCARAGLVECARKNHGKCFQDCAQHVQNICFNPTRIPACTLPVAFEKAYKSRAQCLNDASQQCVRSCLTENQRRDCKTRAYTRCSSIGRLII